MGIRVRVCKDGTRVAWCEWKPGMGNVRKVQTFAEARDNAEAALGALGLHDHVLKRMDRKIATGKGGYKRYGTA